MSKHPSRSSKKKTFFIQTTPPTYPSSPAIVASSSKKKGKSRALHSQQLPQSKGSRVRYHPSLVDIIQQYKADHDQEWDSLPKDQKDDYYNQYQAQGEAIAQAVGYQDPNTDMSIQGGLRAPSPHSGNTPTQSTSTLPSLSLAAQGPLTLAGLAQIVLELGQGMGHLINQVNTLTQNVQKATQTCPRAAKVAVARPKPWNRKGGSVEA